jgi:hypothetical protein
MKNGFIVLLVLVLCSVSCANAAFSKTTALTDNSPQGIHLDDMNFWSRVHFFFVMCLFFLTQCARSFFFSCLCFYEYSFLLHHR